MRSRNRMVTAALLAPLMTAARADEATAPVVVTATRTPMTADDTLASVSVITREEIERRRPLDVPDLLSGLPGIDFSRNGGRGNTTSLYMRGTNGDHTLVLVDGARVGSATSGGPSLESIDPAQIERIEVVRGPRAALYGADAIGGVIQIFTRRDGAHVTTGAGTQDTFELDSGIGRSSENGFWSLNASTLTTDGIDATTPDNFAHDPDRDGYEQTSASLRASRDVTDNLTLDAAFKRSEGESEFDGTPDKADTAQQHLTLGADWSVAPVWTLGVSVGRSLDDYDTRDYGGDRFITRRHTATLQNDFYPTPGQIVTLGVDYRRDEVGGTIDYAEASRDNVGMFLQNQWLLGDWDLQLGARHDDNEAYGESTTGSAALGYRFTDDLRGRVSFGTAFKAPTFNDLYYPDVGYFRGNPDLDPERSRSWEIGLAGGANPSWEIAAFRTEVNDLIVYDATSGRSENVDEAHIHGVEGGLAATVGGFDTRISATWVDPRDEKTDNRLPRRARFSTGLDVSRRIGRAEFGGGLEYHGERFDAIANETRLGGYTLINLNAAWHFTPAWVIRATVRNAADHDYHTAATYNTPARTAMLTLGWNPRDGE